MNAYHQHHQLRTGRHRGRAHPVGARRHLWTAGCVLIAALIGGLPAPASAASPKAYRAFCAGNPAECVSAAPAHVPHHLVPLLAEVNAEVNDRVVWTRDTSNTWLLADKAGDCEDYALTKRAELVARGVPAGALRMAVVRTAHRDEAHAVLVALTADGWLVLDNASPVIRSAAETRYRWVGVATGDPLDWVLL